MQPGSMALDDAGTPNLPVTRHSAGRILILISKVPMSPRKNPRKPARSAATDAKAKGWTAEERDAMKERVRELKSDAGESDLLAKIAAMPEPDRAMATRLHALIRASAPSLAPKTWYGMPAYARDGDVVCFFQAAAKFKARYATFGFSDKAGLDDGAMWPVAFALTKLTAVEEARIVALVKQAALAPSPSPT